MFAKPSVPMSMSTGGDPTTPLINKLPRAMKRNRLRNSTFIIPGTGRRVNRQITLRDESDFDGSSSRRNSNGGYQTFERRWSTAGNVDSALHNGFNSIKHAWKWLGTPTGKGIIKCCIAYLLGCSGTLFPPLAAFLGHQDGKHVVATMVTYFHPARTAGSMIEAVLLMLVAVAYAIFIGVSSMTVAVVCETQLDLIELGYFIVLVIFVGGGLGMVGWTKQKMSSPLVNVACSLTSLSIITIVTKENAVQSAVFSNNKIVQVLKMLTLAMTFTVGVNLLIFPVSARTELHDSMIAATNTLGDQLTTITHCFLTGNEAELQGSEFTTLIKSFAANFASLKKNLRESKFEQYFLGREAEYQLESRVVKSMQQLAQSLGGLKSAATTQFSLLRETSSTGMATPRSPDKNERAQNKVHASESPIKTKPDRFAILTAIDEAENETSDAELWNENEDLLATPTGAASSLCMPTLHTPSEIFYQFILQLGPSMKSLAWTLSQMLNELPCAAGPPFQIAINDNFSNSLSDAIILYGNARREAIVHLYRSKELARERSPNVEADFEEVAASCGYFSFCLQDFAEEMQIYLESLEDLQAALDSQPRRSWNWLKFWRAWKSPTSAKKGLQDQIAEEENALIAEQELERDPDDEDAAQTRDVPALQKVDKKVLFSEDYSAPKNFTTITIPMVKFLERDDVRSALKIGLGASLWAMLAFIPETRPFYNHWRGEWGLLSFMLVCSMTVGASNTTGYSRFIGTLIGAALAIFTWIICQENPFALASCSLIVASYCFYLITAAGQAPFGRFILLTYNLSALYAYSLSVKDDDNDDDEGGISPIISQIALHRVVAVLGGVLWGLIVTRMIWPISARQKLKNGLSALWLRMGLIWGRDPLSAIMDNNPSNAYMNFREELALQKYVIRLDALRTAAASEFEFRGPFPSEPYARIMSSTHKMLDAFHSLNTVIRKDLKANAAESAILQFTKDEREQLSQRISHLFQVLASSMKLEYAVSTVLPSTASARDRLLARVFQFRKISGRLNDKHQQGEEKPQSSQQEIVDIVAENARKDGSVVSDSLDGTTPSRLQKARSASNFHHETTNCSIHGISFSHNISDSELDKKRKRDEAMVIRAEDDDYALLYAYALVTGQLYEEIQKVEKIMEELFGCVDEGLLRLY